MNTKITTIALMLTLILTGCGAGVDPVEDGGIRISDGWGDARIYPVILGDGTHCAALIGGYKGALSCDWGGK